MVIERVQIGLMEWNFNNVKSLYVNIMITFEFPNMKFLRSDTCALFGFSEHYSY